ncbi:hypothetical protein [Shimia sediminis]|uniref:hypothetical protein n=1 Tax=Shimia sediminis TaxID=2497945 RepID=UPI000F8D674C|nr:hypothetical protein [Shimia sediminis]
MRIRAAILASLTALQAAAHEGCELVHKGIWLCDPEQVWTAQRGLQGFAEYDRLTHAKTGLEARVIEVDLPTNHTYTRENLVTALPSSLISESGIDPKHGKIVGSSQDSINDREWTHVVFHYPLSQNKNALWFVSYLLLDDRLLWAGIPQVLGLSDQPNSAAEENQLNLIRKIRVD